MYFEVRRYVGVGFLRRADVTVHRGWASLAGSPDLPTVESVESSLPALV